MMNLDRRSLLGLGLALAALPGLAIPAARAQDADPAKLLTAPPLGDRVLGNAEAPVTIVEFASATCPHCANFHNDTFPALKEEFIDTGKIRFIFREFPFDDLALAAFMLARCAPEDKYYPMLDVLFEQQQNWTRNNPRDELFKIAKLAGFTEDSFNGCLKNTDVAKGIIDGRTQAEKDFGVNSTPTFYINGKLLSGNQPIEKFREMIAAAMG
jgi:protein-disulfide isomerase